MFEITTIATPRTAATLGMPTSAFPCATTSVVATPAAWAPVTAPVAEVRHHVAAPIVAVQAAARVKGGDLAGTPAWRPPTS